MEFWGAEVKSGKPLHVKPGENMVLHLSHACLGEVKKGKGNESVNLFVNIDGKKLVLGTLFSEKLLQQQFDLVFEKDFELSHNWKNGSVYFYGYRAQNPFDESEDEDESESESEDDLPMDSVNNGKPEAQVKQEKSSSDKANAVKDAVGKQKVKIAEPNKDMKPEDEGTSDDSDDPMFEDESDSDEEGDDESDSDEDGDASDDEDEETPKKVQSSKKRPAELAIKTPETDKKAKVVTPQKTDGKKGSVHVATPHPSKQAGKTPANKSSQQTPKSSGSHSCNSCKKSFGTEKALDSHTKAKHSAGK